MTKGYTITELIESEKKKYSEKIETFCKTSERRKIKTDRLQISDLIPSYNVVYSAKKQPPKEKIEISSIEVKDAYYVKYGLKFLY